MSSLRRRLTASFAGVLLVVALVTGVALQRIVTDALVDQFDFGLQAKASALAALLELDGPVIEFDDALASMPEYAADRRDEVFRIWKPDGSVLTHSESLADFELPPRAGSDGAAEAWDLALPDGRPGRALGLVAIIGPDEDLPPVPYEQLPRVTVVVARSRADLDGHLAGVLGGLVGAFGAGLLLGGWGLALGVRRSLRPVDALGQRVAAIDEATLSRRVADGSLPSELRPLADKLDELLERLDAAFGRQRRMTAAMAHELRTPIAELRAATDVARRWPDEPELTDEAVATAADVAARMSAAVDAVMHSCRLEAGQDAIDREPVELRALVETLWAPLAERAAERQVELLNDVPATLSLQTDPRLFALLLRNLLDNAASFSAPGRVRASADHAAGVWLTLENPCAELAEADLEHLGEPFWRKDAARSDSSHSGLGLALVRSLADALGLQPRFELLGGQLRVSLREVRVG